VPIEVAPLVQIADFKAVGKSFSKTVFVGVSPTSNTRQVTLQIRKTSGTGSATFSDNTTSKVITSGQNVDIKGVTESSTMGNFVLEATITTFNQTHTISSKTFTVVSVTLSLRTSGDTSLDNSARSTFASQFGTNSLGLVQGLGIWGTGVEIVGTVLPSNFNGNLVLNRARIGKKIFLDTSLFSTTIGGDDDSTANHRDDNPLPNGYVYDLDAPGYGSDTTNPVGTIWRKRENFLEWAEFENVRVSSDLSWFSCISIEKTSAGDVVKSGVTNDNRAGTGGISLTWNLQ
jgi:hypothetical protein